MRGLARRSEGRPWSAMPVQRAIIVLVAVVFAIAAVVMLPDQMQALRKRHGRAEKIQLVNGTIPALPGLAPHTPEFLTQVEAVVPARDRIRLLVTANGVGPSHCNPAPAQLYFLSYELLPRPVLCDASPRWWVLYLVNDVQLPPGARVVIDSGTGLRLVDTRPGEAR